MLKRIINNCVRPGSRKLPENNYILIKQYLAVLKCTEQIKRTL